MFVKEQAVCRQCHRSAAFSLTMTEVLREGGKGGDCWLCSLLQRPCPVGGLQVLLSSPLYVCVIKHKVSSNGKRRYFLTSI